jgi:RNA binding exosome subunit
MTKLHERECTAPYEISRNDEEYFSMTESGEIFFPEVLGGAYKGILSEGKGHVVHATSLYGKKVYLFADYIMRNRSSGFFEKWHIKSASHMRHFFKERSELLSNKDREALIDRLPDRVRSNLGI